MGKLIGFSHPGKYGDAIYSCPSARWLCEHHGCKGDFYISDYYGKLKPLLDYQPWVNECIIPEDYKVTHHGWGAQPWDFGNNIPREKYEAVYQFGFQHFPDRPLPMWYLHECGFSTDKGFQENVNPSYLGVFDSPDIETLDEPYVVMATRVDREFTSSFYSFIEKCPVTIVQVGAPHEFCEHPTKKTVNQCGLSFLETVSWMSRAIGFYGLISSQGGLAHSFDYPKFFPYHEGWDMRHVVRTPTTMYYYQEHHAVHGDIPIDGNIALEFMGLK